MRGETFKLTYAEWLEHYGMDIPEQPKAMPGSDHIWLFWNRIRARTPNYGEGVSPITLESIEVFSRMTGEIVGADDLAMLEALDNAFVSQVSEERADMQERQRQEIESRQRK